MTMTVIHPSQERAQSASFFCCSLVRLDECVRNTSQVSRHFIPATVALPRIRSGAAHLENSASVWLENGASIYVENNSFIYAESNGSVEAENNSFIYAARGFVYFVTADAISGSCR